MKTPFLIASLFLLLLWPALIEGKDKPEILLYLPSDEGKGTVDPTGLNDQVMSATYSPDGKRITAAGGDGIVQIYTTDMDELLQIAESRVTRQLTAEEKEKYGVLDLN